MRILLVEDEAPLRETLAARLKREGFAVDAAQDGEEGLYMGREVPFDVGIIDLGLPKMSGMELIKALRDEGKKFPVLILTARSSWSRVPTITWSSRSTSKSCWPASTRCCAAPLAGASRPWNAARSHWTSPPRPSAWPAAMSTSPATSTRCWST